MKPRLSSARPCVTRTSRFDPRGAALESVAAEFSLLAQRRARAARQVDLLGRQLSAAQQGLDVIQSRMAMLVRRIDGIDPGLRGPVDAAPPPPPQQQAPAAAFRQPYYRPASAPFALPAPEPSRPPYAGPIGAAAHAQSQVPQPQGGHRKMVFAPGKRQLARRRPFLPE